VSPSSDWGGIFFLNQFHVTLDYPQRGLTFQSLAVTTTAANLINRKAHAATKYGDVYSHRMPPQPTARKKWRMSRPPDRQVCT
jgi:hypothetical protein